MSQTPPGPQGATPPSGTPSNTQAPSSPSDHASNGQNAVQQAISFIEAVLSGDAPTVQAAVQKTETHLISLGLDFVPPTYRGIVQPLVDGWVNGATNQAFITREVGIGLEIAKARMNGFLGNFKL